MTLRYQVLRAPVGGLVFDLQPTGRGFTGQSSETLMKIVPPNALEAKVEIPSSDIGFVREGMNVDISIDSFPATDFGVLEGSVERLGSDALNQILQNSCLSTAIPLPLNWMINSKA